MLLVVVEHLVLLNGAPLGATTMLGGGGARNVPFYIGDAGDERNVVQVEDLGERGVRDKGAGKQGRREGSGHAPSTGRRILAATAVSRWHSRDRAALGSYSAVFGDCESRQRLARPGDGLAPRSH